MQVNNDTQVQEEQPKEKPLTREQRRIKDRIELEAKQTFDLLSERYLNFFITSDDPEGNETVQKLHQISAQWKTYCTKKQLIPEAKTMIENFAASVLKDYQDSKAPKVEA